MTRHGCTKGGRQPAMCKHLLCLVSEGTLAAGGGSWQHTEQPRLASTSAQLATSYL